MTTKIIIPRASGEGGLGIEDATWGHAYFNSGNFNELDVTTNATIGESLTVGGNLTVNGTTTTVNSSVINVDDKNIELGAVDSPTDVTADGGGITLKGNTDKTIIWSAESDDWKFNKGIRSFNAVGGNDIIVTKDVGGAEVVSAGLISDGDGDGSLILSNNVGNTRVSLSSIADSYFMGGKIGIGTTSPYLGLSVEGSAWATSSLGLTRIGGGEHSDSSLVFGSAAGTNAGHAIGGIWFKNTDQSTYSAIIRARTDDTSGVTGRIEFLSGGSVGNSSTPSMTIKGNGKVGIGTTSPGAKLEVHQDGDAFSIKSADTEQKLRVFTAANGGVLGLTDGGVDVIRLDGRASTPNASYFNGGNVGIGTTDPIYPLDVYGFGKTIGITSTHSDSTRITHAALLSDSSGYGILEINSNVGNPVNKLHSNGASYINGGNVGIGTTSPGAKLEVIETGTGSGSGGVISSTVSHNGNAGYKFRTDGVNRWSISSEGVDGANLRIKDHTNNVDRIFFAGATGYMGLRTSVPDSAVHIFGTNNAQSQIHIQNTASASAGNFFITSRYDKPQLEFRNGSGVPMMVVREDNFVGIGEVDPTAKLEINSQLNASGYALKINTETRAFSEGYVWLGRSAAPDFYVNSSGKIGMGTATPDWTLDVECPTGNHAGIRALQSSTTDYAGIRAQNDVSGTIGMFARGSGEVGSTLGISNSNAMQLFTTSASALLIGTNNGSSIYFSTNNTVRAYISSSGTFKVHSLSANSDVQTNASGEFITTSDKRLKNDLGDCEYGLSEITKIVPKKFAWKSDPLQSPTVGFFAQEVHEHIPEAAPKYIRKKILTEAVDASPATYWGEGDELPEGVSLGDEKLPAREGSDATYETQYDSEGNHEYDWGFNSQAIVAALVNCVKELKQENDSLKSRIDALES